MGVRSRSPLAVAHPRRRRPRVYSTTSASDGANTVTTEAVRAAGLRLIEERGWAVLLLATDAGGGKIPPRNCPRCDPRTGDRHDKQSCECLLCHGFYSATTDPDRWDRMCAALPDGRLAVRTGQASGILVIDAEARAANRGEPSGLEVLDDWENWAGGWELPATLAATSVSGGVHLYYRLPPGVEVRSGRILPNVDVKAEAGYVGAPTGETARRWVDEAAVVADAPPELIKMLVGGTRRLGGPGGQAAPGYDFETFAREGCPDGHRDFFFNDLAFRLRKRGLTRERYDDALREAWERVAQPPDARYYMPWEHVEYKAERVWNEVGADPDGGGWRPPAANDPEGTGDTGGGETRVLAEPPVLAENPTDTGNGLRLTRLLGDRLRYCSSMGVWFIWDGMRWRPDDAQRVLDLTKHVIADLYEHADVMRIQEGNEEGTRWRRWAKDSESIVRRRAMLASAAAEPRVAVRRADIDADPGILVVRNGTVDLRTGVLRDHDPADLCTRLCPVDWDDRADSKMLWSFMELFLADVPYRRFVLQSLGVALAGGNPLRLFTIIQGGTTSGKSTLVELMSATLGDYMLPVNISVFRGNNDDRPRPDLLRALDARIIYASEAATSWELHTDQVKRMTGGDALVGRAMRSDVMVEKAPAFSPLIVTNEMPHVKGADAAVRRRLLVLPFGRTLAPSEEDPEFKDRMVADDEARSTLLWWLVSGGVAALRSRLVTRPTVVDMATQEAFAAMDHVAEFIVWGVEVGRLVYDESLPASACARTSDVHSSYVEWVRHHGTEEDRRTRLGLRRLCARLEELGWRSSRSAGTRWVGWRLGIPGIDVGQPGHRE